MSNLMLLVLGLVLFLGVHSVSIVSHAGRNRLAQRLGENTWKGLYSLVALAGLVLIVIGYGQARVAPVLVYAMPTGFRHLAALLMLPAFVLLAAAYLPGRIQRATKHPMLLAVKLWALAHLLAQSVTGATLADILLFGGFLLWAGVDRMSLKRRGKPPAPLAAGSTRNDVLAVVIGLAAYGVTVTWLHGWLFGVRPLG